MTERTLDNEAEQLLTIAEAAAYLRVHKQTVRRYIAANKLTASRLPSGVIRLKRSDLDAMLAGGAA